LWDRTTLKTPIASLSKTLYLIVSTGWYQEWIRA